MRLSFAAQRALPVATTGADRAWWSGRSSKPRRRRLRQLRWVRFPHAPAIVALALARSLAAQDTVTVVRPAPPAAQARDTSHLLRPLPAFFASALVPGLGQAMLDRKLTGALFMTWEGVTLGMTLKAAHELRFLERTAADSSRLEQKRQERQDWLVLLVFNHLFAGLEAFVSSHLQDFPADVRLRVLPGGLGIGARVPTRWP